MNRLLHVLFADGFHCWATLVAVVLGSGILATTWAWRTRLRKRPLMDAPESGIGIDLMLTLVVACLSAFHQVWLHDAINSEWYPYAQDFRDFLSHTLAALDPSAPRPNLFRYPMFGWISAAVCRIGHLPPYLGTMWASLASGILLPVALFLLGRQIAPRLVAIAGAFLFCHFDPVVRNMGTPTDYPFCTLAYVGLLAAGTWALRRGGTGRFLVFGLACAIMLGATAKGLTVVLPALAFALIGLAWHGRGHPRRVPSALAAFVLPLVAIWTIYHQAGVQASSLEFQVFSVMNQDAYAISGKPAQYSPTWNWNMGTRTERRGYWVVGQTEALTHFPSVIRFFVDPPDGRPYLATRERNLVRSLGTILNLKQPWLLLLAIPGCLAGLVRREKGPWVPSILVAGLCLTETLGQVWGGISIEPEFRYIQPLVITLPLLVLAGAAGLPRLLAPRGSRSPENAFWPVMPLLVAVLFVKASPFSAARLIRETALTPLEPLYGVWSLQEDLWPGDGIVDFTSTRIADFVLFGTETPVLAGYAPALRVGERYMGANVAASDWRRRFLVVEACDASVALQETWWSCLDRWFASNPERFRRIQPCIVEDRAPGLPIHVDPETDCRIP